MNTFKIGDPVRTKNNTRTNGVVKYVACVEATMKGGRKCDKKTCTHKIQDYCWVKWHDGVVCSYEYTELEFEKAVTAAPVQVIGTDEAKPTIDGEALALVDSRAAKEQEQAFFDFYNGYKQVRYGRDGREYVVDMTGGSKANTTEIQNDEIDWDVYTGKKPGSVRKK